MKRSWLVLAPLFLSLALSPSACKKTTSDDEGKASSDDKKKGKKTGDDEDDDQPKGKKKKSEDEEDFALGDKINPYIKECLNVFSKSIRQSEGRYYEWVDPKKGPTGNEPHIRGLYEVILDPETCAKAVKAASKLEPKKEELEKAGDAYVDAIKAIIPLTKEAYKYYDRQDYKDDKLKKGKELHPKLVSAFDAFAKADRELAQRVDEVQEGLSKRDLARIEKKEGKKLRWHCKNSVLLGKALIAQGARDPQKIDLAKLTETSDAFAKAVDDLDDWSTKNKDKASPASWYLSGAKDLVTVSKSLVRRLKDKTPYSAHDKSIMGTSAGWMVKGSPDEMLDRYNKMIGSYNTISWPASSE